MLPWSCDAPLPLCCWQHESSMLAAGVRFSLLARCHDQNLGYPCSRLSLLALTAGMRVWMSLQVSMHFSTQEQKICSMLCSSSA